jgi:hypothetical protein
VARQPCTVCVDFETGLQLAVYPGKLNQVLKGAEFYVGQKPYLVEAIAAGGDDDDLLIVLRTKANEAKP